MNVSKTANALDLVTSIGRLIIPAYGLPLSFTLLVRLSYIELNSSYDLDHLTYSSLIHVFSVPVATALDFRPTVRLAPSAITYAIMRIDISDDEKDVPSSPNQMDSDVEMLDVPDTLSVLTSTPSWVDSDERPPLQRPIVDFEPKGLEFIFYSPRRYQSSLNSLPFEASLVLKR